MKTLINHSGTDTRIVETATTALREGRMIIFPTDTLPALGCDALNPKAVETLCRFKNINPAKATLSIVCANLSMAAQYARIDNTAYNIIRRYLPGPFTFLLPAATTLPRAFRARKTVGIRIPDNDMALALAVELGGPILSSSADETPDSYPADMLIDDGTAPGEPSAVIDLTDSHNPKIIRTGPIDFDD